MLDISFFYEETGKIECDPNSMYFPKYTWTGGEVVYIDRQTLVNAMYSQYGRMRVPSVGTVFAIGPFTLKAIAYDLNLNVLIARREREQQNAG